MSFDLATLGLGSQSNTSFRLAWIAATRGVRYLARKEIKETDISMLCDELMTYLTSVANTPRRRISLRLTAMLTDGILKIYRQQVIQFQNELFVMMTTVSRPRVINRPSSLLALDRIRQEERDEGRMVEAALLSDDELQVPGNLEAILTVGMARIDDITLREEIGREQPFIHDEIETFGSMYGDDSQSEDTTLAEMEQQSQQILPEDDEQVTGHVLKDDEPTVPISTRTRELIPEQVEKVVSNGKNLFQDEISMPGQCDVVEAETETTETTAVQSKGMKRKRAQKQQVDLVEESSSSRTLSKFRLNLSRPSRFRTIDRFEESVLQVYTPPLPPMIREQSTLYQVNDLYSSEGDDQESQMVGSEAENTSIDTTRDVVSPFEPSSPEPEDLEIEDLPAAASTPLEFESSEEIFTGYLFEEYCLTKSVKKYVTEDNNNNIDENNETRRDNMVECVSKWDQDRAIEITDVCSQPVKRLNIAKAFQDLLVLQKEGQVKLIKEDNSLELKSIEKGPKLL